MGNRIESAMKDVGLDQTALAAIMGISPQAVQQWTAGKTQPKGKRLEKLLQTLKCDAQWLLTGKGSQYPANNQPAEPVKNIQELSNITSINTFGKVPLISWVQAGEWCEAIDNYAVGDAEEWLPCPVAHGARTYALRVRGDSMTAPYSGQRSYPEGTLIYVDADKHVTNGCRVIAKLPHSNEVTFKEYREEDGKRYLKPLNPQYPTQEITQETHICGVVIGQFMAE